MGRNQWAMGLVLALSVAAFFSAADVAAKAIAPLTKGVAPQNASCDHYVKSSASWRGCIGRLSANKTDDELFYAGYWLAKTGRFDEALQFLNSTRRKDERVLTYIGFATRKSGHVKDALTFYQKALVLNPDFVIARSYLGEAHLTMGKLEKARAELREIAKRCGNSCVEYKLLEDAIAHYKPSRT